MGQSLDLSTANDLSKFTMDRYEAIVKYKTAFYSFQLPVALAMHMVSDSVYLCITRNLVCEVSR
jgi:Geranylgeranyl pyrophosphate synthase